MSMPVEISVWRMIYKNRPEYEEKGDTAVSLRKEWLNNSQ